MEIEFINDVPQALKLKDHSSIASLDTFRDGFFQVQGISSILTGHILGPQVGERILDLCSAPGGKTTHLAELMNDEGEIIANELHESKLSLIEQNCARLGIDIANLQSGDGRNIEFDYSFDRILIDAPCSGLGMIAKKPEIKWQKKPQDIKALSKVQLALLNNGSKFLKVGGELVYSTCTITDRENSEVIKEFLNTNPDFELLDLTEEAEQFGIDAEFIKEGSIQILPTWRENEGYFIAKLKRIS
jgi:16S rRNA (cytosine967-C5)-methyltransferase